MSALLPEDDSEELDLWIEELLSRHPDNSIPHINDYVKDIQNSD